MSEDWKLTISYSTRRFVAPENEEIWTKIHDDGGEPRNIAKLTRRGNLWFTDPKGGMYVYYIPTHWHR
jgi:hypothetical protein